VTIGESVIGVDFGWGVDHRLQRDESTGGCNDGSFYILIVHVLHFY